MANDNGADNLNDNAPSGGVSPVFPSDYEDTFAEVVSCYLVQPHGASYTRIFVNEIGEAGYRAGENPLPVGAIVIKAEYSAAGCADDLLTGWTALRKEAAGFNPDAGDWHWQLVSRSTGVLFDDESTCIGCHSAESCLARDYTCAVR